MGKKSAGGSIHETQALCPSAAVHSLMRPWAAATAVQIGTANPHDDRQIVVERTWQDFHLERMFRILACVAVIPCS